MNAFLVEHVAEIVKISNERGVDFSVAASMFLSDNGYLEKFSSEEIAGMTGEFYTFIKGKTFDGDGNVTGSYTGIGSGE